MTQDILIHGVWIRAIGGKVELLVELDDGWHLCAIEPLDGAFGHIVEPSGIRQSRKDYLRDSTSPYRAAPSPEGPKR